MDNFTGRGVSICSSLRAVEIYLTGCNPLILFEESAEIVGVRISDAFGDGGYGKLLRQQPLVRLIHPVMDQIIDRACPGIFGE
ncbi:hypothetical protein D3C73_1389510 [compost metagenome]